MYRNTIVEDSLWSNAPGTLTSTITCAQSQVGTMESHRNEILADTQFRQKMKQGIEYDLYTMDQIMPFIRFAVVCARTLLAFIVCSLMNPGKEYTDESGAACRANGGQRPCQEAKAMEKIKGVNFGNWLVLEKWMDPGMKNVMLDTHIYIFAMQMFLPRAWWISALYMKFNRWTMKRAQRYTTVMVGEWCLSNKVTVSKTDPDEVREVYRRIGRMQLAVWNTAAGWCYWNYQLGRDLSVPMDEAWKDSWDPRRCWEKKWMPDA